MRTTESSEVDAKALPWLVLESESLVDSSARPQSLTLCPLLAHTIEVDYAAAN